MISSTSFIGHPGNVFAREMWNLPSFLMLPVVMLLVARHIVGFYRRTVRMSIYDYLERRFNYGARAYGAAAFIVSRVVDMSATLYFLAVPVSYLSGFDVWWVILVVGLVTVVMTVAGGIASVVYADVLQGVLLAAGVLVCLGIALFRPPAGMEAVLTAAWEGGKFGLGEWSFSLVDMNGWFLVVGGAIWAVQRYAWIAHRAEISGGRHRPRGPMSAFVGALSACHRLLFFLLAPASGLLSGDGQALPPEVARVRTTSSRISSKPSPRGMIGLVIAALLAAAMSDLDSDLNSMATVIVEDYFGRLRPGRPTAASLGRPRRRRRSWRPGHPVLAALDWHRHRPRAGGPVVFDRHRRMLGLFALGGLTRRANGRGPSWALPPASSSPLGRP
jgi:SSS family solute:Na+ symporter